MEHKPVIGVTIGDFNGIGPEIILKVFTDPAILKFCTPIIYGSSKILAKYRKLFNYEEQHQNTFLNIKSTEQHSPKRVNVLNCWEEDHAVEPGKVTERAGLCAWKSLKDATEDLKKGWIDAIVTNPINKANIQNDEFKFPGHTEFFAHNFAVGTDSLMFLVAEDLRVGVVTGHIPLKDVASSISQERISSKLNLMLQSLKKDFAIHKPRIAVLGLNPHAGEDGLLGAEEKEIIIPVINDFKNKGHYIFGPYPSDGFFGKMLHRKFDAVLAMYHDQGLIPFKTLAFENGVNYTAGLSIVRTSPDHGTAYDIAGKNIANENSLREALYLVCEIFKNRRKI